MSDPTDESNIMDTFMVEVGGKTMSLGDATPSQLKEWLRVNRQKWRMIERLYPDKVLQSDDHRE